MQPIYARARKHYEISRYPGDTIIVHESTIPVEEWSENVDGACRVLPPVPVKHLELLAEEYTHLWLEEFVSPLGSGAGLAAGSEGGREAEVRPDTGERRSSGLGAG